MGERTAFLRLAKAIVLGHDDGMDNPESREDRARRFRKTMDRSRLSGFQMIRPATFLIDTYKINDDN